MKIYAVIDTNVIVSALLSKYADAATVLILKKIFEAEIVPVFNKEIIQEYSTVLRRSKFGFPETLIESFIDSIIDFGIFSERLSSDINLPDPKDIVFYEVTLSIEDSYLVTGNTKHFPKEPFIVTPAEMLHILESVDNSSENLLNEPSLPYGKTVSE